ncbi:hypothetical protein ACHQM5_014699 [Ranunculus cassubicifolius]
MTSLANKSFSFRSLLDSTSKYSLWDIYEKNKRVYRFSTIFMIILRGYIKRLIDSHKQGKCHSWPDLEENIIFQRNKYNRITFLIKPMRPNTDEGEDFKKSDFEALVDLITKSRISCNLSGFPQEINDFVELLHSGDAELALHHCALWKSKKRARYVMDIYREWMADSPEFSVVAEKLNDEEEMSKFIPPMFWTVVEKDKVLTECCELIRDSGEYAGEKQEKFKKNFAGLLEFMHKTYKHCTLDSMGNFYCQTDMEWKFFCYYPSLISELWKIWKGKEKDYGAHFELGTDSADSADEDNQGNS